MFRAKTRHRTLRLCLGGEATLHGEAKRSCPARGFEVDLLSNFARNYRKYNVQDEFYSGNIVATRLQP